MLRKFQQVDVFTSVAYFGNALAVVPNGEGLTTEQMQRFALWTNLAETTFVLPPVSTEADYKVRIFTPAAELPFAGHPTLGTCHVWLTCSGIPKEPGVVVQECGAGLVRIRRNGTILAFAAPPLLKGGPVDEALLNKIVNVLKISRKEVIDAQWVDNGPGWIGLMLADADAVLAIEPDFGATRDLFIGVIGPSVEDSDCAFEVRALYREATGPMREDPVTGSLNAALAQWLIATGRATAPYISGQGTRLDRKGRVMIEQDDNGIVWVGGNTVTCITGEVEI